MIGDKVRGSLPPIDPIETIIGLGLWGLFMLVCLAALGWWIG